MTNKNMMKKDLRQRLTAFVSPDLIKRAKVRGALEGLTISEIVEKALDAYAPRIEKGSDQHIHLKFISGAAVRTLIPETALKTTGTVSKNTKFRPTVP